MQLSGVQYNVNRLDFVPIHDHIRHRKRFPLVKAYYPRLPVLLSQAPFKPLRNPLHDAK